jgi:hypothetical protein
MQAALCFLNHRDGSRLARSGRGHCRRGYRVLLLYRRSLVKDSRRAQDRADGYLRHLVLLHLQSTRSGLDYLNRLVEDLGVDEYTLTPALDRLKREKLVIGDTDKQRGAYFKLTPKGTDWRPEAGHHSRSGY